MRAMKSKKVRVRGGGRSGKRRGVIKSPIQR
jgi:hypothetical protein